MCTSLPAPHSLCRSGITWIGRETTCWAWHDWPKTFWPRFPTSSFLTWRAGASNPTRRRLRTRLRDTHTTHRSELLILLSLESWGSCTGALGFSSQCHHVFELSETLRGTVAFLFVPFIFSARFFSGKDSVTQGQLFCLFCLKISISWPVTVSYFVDQLTRGRRARGGGGGWCLWFQLVPVCDCLSVPGQVCPNLTLGLTPRRYTRVCALRWRF